MTPKSPRPPVVRTERTDPQIKINLPPLMGRRNARFARLGECLAPRFASLSAADRRRRCREVDELIAQTEADTRLLRQMLNSPDTRRREEWLLAFLSLLRRANRSLLEAVEANAELAEALESGLFTPEEIGLEPASAKAPDRLAGGLAARLHKLFRNGRQVVEGYFRYAVNSLAREHRERYDKAFAATRAETGDPAVR